MADTPTERSSWVSSHALSGYETSFSELGAHLRQANKQVNEGSATTEALYPNRDRDELTMLDGINENNVGDEVAGWYLEYTNLRRSLKRGSFYRSTKAVADV